MMVIELADHRAHLVELESLTATPMTAGCAEAGKVGARLSLPGGVHQGRGRAPAHDHLKGAATLAGVAPLALGHGRCSGQLGRQSAIHSGCNVVDSVLRGFLRGLQIVLIGLQIVLRGLQIVLLRRPDRKQRKQGKHRWVEGRILGAELQLRRRSK